MVSAMPSIYLFNAPTAISSTLSRTINLSSSIAGGSLRPFSFPVVGRLLHSNHSLIPNKSILIPCRSFSYSTSRFCSGGFSGSVGSDEEEEIEEFDGEEEEEDYSNGEDYEVDAVALEKEAKDAVREYSSSLSRLLTIGVCVCVRVS